MLINDLHASGVAFFSVPLSDKQAFLSLEPRPLCSPAGPAMPGDDMNWPDGGWLHHGWDRRFTSQPDYKNKKWQNRSVISHQCMPEENDRYYEERPKNRGKTPLSIMEGILSQVEMYSLGL